MIYEFKNKNGDIVEKQYRVGKCPKSIKVNGVKYERIISLPYVIMDPDKPKTVGGLIDQQKRSDEKKGKVNKEKEVPTPWWRKGKKKVDMDLAKMSTKQKENYIMTGEKKI
jgi:hypothetical protein